MAKSDLPNFVEAMREAANRALAAVDTLVRDLGLGPGHPVAAALELQREVIFSISRLGELVAEVGEAQSNALESPEMRAALQKGAEMGADAGFRHVASQMRRRAVLHSLILGAGMAVLGGIALAVGFSAGSRHELRAMVVDCLHNGAELTPAGERVCAVLMSPK